MAPLLEDPRIRQTWNSISQNAESATETAAAGIWTFTHTYISPCLSSISSIISQCTGLCFPDREERERARRLRERGRTRGRAEYSFDFYDDWDEDIDSGSGGGLLGWGNDELDRLLAGSGSHSHGTDEQPTGRRRGMSYGTRKVGARRKSTIDGLPDPTIIPSTNPLGFLQRLPWKMGGTLRYKPSAADLQEHPGANRVELIEEGEPLLDGNQGNPEEEGFDASRTRKRSSTTDSGDTSDSFRSRGDLFPSDGEDDAVPLSDEFAMVLERRITQGSGTDDRGSSKTRSSKGKRAAGSGAISRNVSRTTQSSGNSRPSAEGTRVSSATELHANSGGAAGIVETPSLTRLEQEEEQLRQEEDAEIERKRHAAANLAAQRGLSINEDPPYDVTREDPVEIKQEDPILEDIRAPSTEMVDIRDNAPTIATSPENATLEVAKGLDKVFVPAKLPNFS